MQQEPFFQDNLEGWLKVIGLFLTGLGAIITLVVKLVSSPFNRRLEVVEGEIETTLERRTIIDTEMDTLKLQQQLMKYDQDGLRDSYVRFETKWDMWQEKEEVRREQYREKDNKVMAQLERIQARLDMILDAKKNEPR